jgi:hypothetical protein
MEALPLYIKQSLFDIDILPEVFQVLNLLKEPTSVFKIPLNCLCQSFSKSGRGAEGHLR